MVAGALSGEAGLSPRGWLGKRDLKTRISGSAALRRRVGPVRKVPSSVTVTGRLGVAFRPALISRIVTIKGTTKDIAVSFSIGSNTKAEKYKSIAGNPSIALKKCCLR